MDFNQIEQKILEFWEKNRIFNKSLRKNKSKKNFVFFEGPPTANGRPGIHHVEARSFKDIIPRYKTMRGFFVGRKAGWDTHGLPVEIEVEKQLGLKSKKEIEKYGIAKFNQECRKSVWKYKDEWEKLTKRIGFWLDLEKPYITYENYYIESVWNILKKVWDKGLMYKGFKVVPHCPRCVTTLSSHEVSQGYKTVKENSVFVKFHLRAGQKWGGRKYETKNTAYVLVWTTTPWTLPANVGLAVGENISYTAIRIKDIPELLIVASDRLKDVFGDKDFEVVHNDIKGKDLIDLKYEPLYKNPNQKEMDLRVVAGDFVSTEEGTGIVHIAPAYGEDDLNVGQKEGLSVIHTVDSSGIVLGDLNIPGEGKFIKETDKNKDVADKHIVENLKQRNLLFAEKKYEHEYPFCWRCDSPLLYYAKESWFIRMSDLRDKLVTNNKKINWEPAHIKEGRFGEFIREVKDWAVSRERFWGTPLPVWKCGKCGKKEAVGSVKELKSKALRSGNKFFLMRHGQAESNLKHIIVSNIKNNHSPLTEKGKKESLAAAKRLKNKKIDLIFASDFLRTTQTAEIVAGALGYDKNKIIFDERIREINTGIFNEKTPKEYHAYFSSVIEKFSKIPPEGENLVQLKNRAMSFLTEADKKYQNKNILVISHEYTTWMSISGLSGLNNEEAAALMAGKKSDFLKTAEILEAKEVGLPRDENNVLDLHRPYIDGVKLKCECGGEMARETDVVDVWFDSGSMPFAQWGYPNTKGSEKEFKNNYPGDYIAEGIDQTRGWFYTLLAISTLMEHCGMVKEGLAYKNIICLGLVLDKFGKKMSKSKGNIVDPWEMCEKFGADTVRWYFYTVNQAGDPKKFDTKDLQDKNRRIFGTLYNSLVFFQTYADKKFSPKKIFKSKNLLDRWIFSRFNTLNEQVTNYLEKYDIVSAARLIEYFIDDLSNWFIRRSRERFQRPKIVKEKDEASQALYLILLNLAKIMAPFAPFMAEEIYQSLTTAYGPPTTARRESVHLCDWPKPEKKLINKKIEEQMGVARGIVALALGERIEKKIRVRQPLARLGIGNQELGKNKELMEIIKDEVNVKEIKIEKNIKNKIELNVEITEELKEEGMAREIVRQIQSMRKEAGFVPGDIITVKFEAPSVKLRETIKNWADYIKKETNARSSEREITKFDLEKEIDFEGEKLKISIRKIK